MCIYRFNFDYSRNFNWVRLQRFMIEIKIMLLKIHQIKKNQLDNNHNANVYATNLTSQ